MAGTNRQLRTKRTQTSGRQGGRGGRQKSRNRDSSGNRKGLDKGTRQQQEVEPAKRIRNQVAVWADSKTSVLKRFCPSQEASWLLPAQMEIYLTLWPAYTWQLAAPGNTDPQLYRMLPLHIQQMLTRITEGAHTSNRR